MSVAALAAIVLGCADSGALLAAAAMAKSAPIVLAETSNEAASAETAPSRAETSESVLSFPDSSAAPLVFDGESDEAVVERVLSYIDAITTLQGDFTQVAPSGAISTGKLYLRRPGLLRFDYDEPSPLLIVANGGLVYVRDEALETTDSYPVGATPLKFLLRKRIELADARVVAVDRGEDMAAVTFASTSEETEGELSVVLRAPDLQLQEWIVRDPQNGVTIVSLENLIAGESIPNRLFAAPEADSPFLKN